MEDILRTINAAPGVLGSLICDVKGRVLASTFPDQVEKSVIEGLSRTLTQTISALAIIIRRKIDEIDLVFHQGRVITINLGESCLSVLCAQNINASLLKMAITPATTKLAEMVAERKEISAPDVIDKPAWESQAQTLNTEVRSIISAARIQGVVLQATGDAAIRLRCPSALRMKMSLDEQVLDLVSHEKQTAQLNRIMDDLGYSPDRLFNMLHGKQKCRFTHPEKGFHVEVSLDALKGNLHLDLSERLGFREVTITLADVLLWKLHDAQVDEQVLQAIHAILSDYDLGTPGESEKIDSTRILQLCTADWGWYRVVTDALESYISWVDRISDAASVGPERARRLLQMIKEAPKTGSWQLRAMFDEDTHL